MFFNILFCGCFLYTSASAFNYTELELGGRFCGSSSSCTNFTTDEEERNCYCDEKCDVYDDCCVDSPLYNSRTTTRMNYTYPFVCIRNLNDYVYAKNRCPSSWTDENTRKQCEASNKNDTWTDPLSGIHVTSFAGNKITYTNIYCARCNDDDQNLYFWDLLCSNNNMVIRPTEYLHNIVYNSTLHKWQVKVKGKYFKCTKIYSISSGSIDRDLRRCFSAIKMCPPDSNFSNFCQLYTSVVYRGRIPYRNVHCALCNNVPSEQLSCTRYNGIIAPCKLVESFTVLVDLNIFKTVEIFNPCWNDYKLYDPYFGKCRNAFYKWNSDKQCDLKSNYISSCPTFHLTESEYSYIAQNNSIFVPKYNKLLNSNNFYFPRKDNGGAEICINILVNLIPMKYKPYFDTLQLVGITISVVCLITHLLVFSLVEHLRNLPGMNLASYCLTLLISYCSLLLNVYAKNRDQICLQLAIAKYYFLLTSFFWMLTISFDVWRVSRLATRNFRAISGKQWKIFIAYSCCSWLTPLVLVSISILADMSDNTPRQFRPDFGQPYCWFTNSNAIEAFLKIPLSVIIILTLIFFVSSAFTIYRNRCVTTDSNTWKNFKLFSRLFTLMGLSRIVGLILVYVYNEYARVASIVLNTFQGFFIFVGFTCKKEVYEALKRIAVSKACCSSSAKMVDF